MNHFVPDFDTDDDYINVNPTNPSSSSSSLNLPRKSTIGEEDDLMELLWHNGQVVLQNQRLNNNSSSKKPSSSSSGKLHGGDVSAPPQHQHQQHQQQRVDENLFIHEDEMTSWLHYPLREDDFCSDLLFSASASAPRAPTPEQRQTTTQVPAARPPEPSVRPPTPSARPPIPSERPAVRNFMNFSRLRGDFTGRFESGRRHTVVTPSVVVTATPSSNESGLPVRRRDGIDSGLTTVNCDGSSSAVAHDSTAHGNSGKGKAVAAESEIPGTVSKSETEPVIVQQPKTMNTIVDDRKRKEREAAIDETESRSEETKQGRGSTTSTKRSRASEVHNLSERKRRDRINERMKALQELIPRCNKSDKASMLDEAIEYMKSLQLQIQMMSMGCVMMPMMNNTGMQQYMSHMAMGMGIGMNGPTPHHHHHHHHPFMPFPNMLAAAAQRPLPPQTHMSSASDSSRVYLPNYRFDPASSQSQYPGYIDPYQQFRNIHPAQQPQFQNNQATLYPSSSRVSSSKNSEDQGNHTTG